MLRGGFIGLGRMGITHLSILNTHPSVKVVAVADQSKTILSILKKYVDIDVYYDYQQMIDNIDLDFVVISTPSQSHSNIINYAISKDLHVFTEKPFAMTSSDGQNTIDLLKGKQLVNQVGYVNRFNEIFTEIKKLIEHKVIGEVKNFRSEMYGPTVLKDSKRTWRGDRKMGGGCLYEFGSHCIDLPIYLFGKPEKVAGSIMQSIYSSGVDDLVISNFIYNSGCSGTIMVNWSDESYRKPTNIVTIIGSKGKIIADKHAYKMFLKTADKKNGFQKGWNRRYITDFAKSVRFYVRGNEFTRQLDYFINCINEKQYDNISNFEEAYKTDVIMEKIQQDSSRTFSSDISSLRSSGGMLSTKKRAPFWKRLIPFAN
jgi:predicted dehydrogenase